MITPLLFLSYTLLLIATLAAISLPIVHAVKGIISFKATAIRLGILTLLSLGAYGMADHTTTYAPYGVGPNTAQYIGAGLILMYMLMALSLVSILGAVFYKSRRGS